MRRMPSYQETSVHKKVILFKSNPPTNSTTPYFHTYNTISKPAACSISTLTTRTSPSINSLPMLSIFQVNLEITDSRFRTRCVKFSRAVMTFYSRQIYVSHVIWGGLTWWRSWARQFRSCVDGSIPHKSFKLVVRIGSK